MKCLTLLALQFPYIYNSNVNVNIVIAKNVLFLGNFSLECSHKILVNQRLGSYNSTLILWFTSLLTHNFCSLNTQS